MNSRIYTSSEILKALGIKFYQFDYMIRSGKITPIAEGRTSGRERRFTEEEFEKAKDLARFTQTKSQPEKSENHGIE